MTKLITRKTYQQNGKWIERPGRNPILICECGNKYIKTRDRQVKCLICVARMVVVK